MENYIQTSRVFNIIRMLTSLKPEQREQLDGDPVYKATKYHVDDIAVINGYNEILHVSLKENIFNAKERIDNPIYNDNPKLIHAASKGNVFILDTLIKHKANVKIMNSKGQNILHVAVENGHKEAISTILTSDRGKKLLKRRDTEEDMTPWMLAARIGNTEIFEMLKACDETSVVRKRNKCKRSADFYAAEGGHLDVLKSIHKSKKLSITLDCKGYTQLTIAIENNHPEIVRYIIEQLGEDYIFEKNSHLFIEGNPVSIIEAVLRSKWPGLGYILFSELMLPEVFLEKIQNNELVEVYTEALQHLGMQKILKPLNLEYKEQYKSFMKSHLLFLATHKNEKNFRELITYLLESAEAPESQKVEDPKIQIKSGTVSLQDLNIKQISNIGQHETTFSTRSFQLNREELQSILSHKDKSGFTALHYINKNHDIPGAVGLILAEKEANADDKKKGLQNIGEKAGDFPLRPWMLETYDNCHQDEENSPGRIGKALFMVLLGLISLGFLLYDFGTDIELVAEYIMLWLGDVGADLNCTTMSHYEENGFESYYSTFHIQVTVVFTFITLMISLVGYGIVVIQYEPPKAFDKKFKWPCKFVWPLVHFYYTWKKEMTTQKDELADDMLSDTNFWKYMKILEHCIENSVQFFLQILVVHKFLQLPLTPSDLFNVLGTYISSGNACLAEKSMRKILITVVSLSFGISFLKTGKPGLNIGKHLFKSLFLTVGILLHTVARSLVIAALFSVPPYGWSALIYICIHFIMVAAIFIYQIYKNTTMEVSNGDVSKCLKFLNLLTSFKQDPIVGCIQFILSLISSTTHLTNLHEDTEQNAGRELKTTTRYAHFWFQILILVENLAIAFMSTKFPFKYGQITAGLILTGLWLGGVSIQVIYYCFLHDLGLAIRPGWNDIKEIFSKYCPCCAPIFRWLKRCFSSIGSCLPTCDELGGCSCCTPEHDTNSQPRPQDVEGGINEQETSFMEQAQRLLQDEIVE